MRLFVVWLLHFFIPQFFEVANCWACPLSIVIVSSWHAPTRVALLPLHTMWRAYSIYCIVTFLAWLKLNDANQQRSSHYWLFMVGIVERETKIRQTFATMSKCVFVTITIIISRESWSSTSCTMQYGTVWVSNHNSIGNRFLSSHHTFVITQWCLVWVCVVFPCVCALIEFNSNKEVRVPFVVRTKTTRYAIGSVNKVVNDLIWLCACSIWLRCFFTHFHLCITFEQFEKFKQSIRIEWSSH